MYAPGVKNYYKQYIWESIEPNNLRIFNDIFNIFLTGQEFIGLYELAKYLGAFKRNLKATLVKNYVFGKDYIIEFAPNNDNNEKYVYVTIDCAKRLCLRSNAPNAEMVRDYFIFAEEMYQEYMLGNIEYKLDETDGDFMEGGQTNFKVGECVYVIAIEKGNGYIYKIGKTKNLNERYRQHVYSIPNLVGVIYYELFKHNRFLEVCIQDYLSHRQLSIRDLNDKNLVEIFASDLDNIIELFEFCKKMRETNKFVQKPNSNRPIKAIWE